MSDRLEELRHQRALLQQHLAWIDAEIAAATRTPPAPGMPSTTDQPDRHSHSVRAPVASPALEAQPAAAELAPFIAEQKNAPADSAQEAKRGCILAFSLLLLILGAAVLAWYLYFRATH
ncbi:MAG: hypothetical protein KF715_00850 [Candidatus Didemnitutus sp.]|nr:hypothetical protein [Candidatus Didemnitutus sp.]